MAEASEEQTRLNKYLALQLGISRREADEMIAMGKVTVNGTPAILGARIMPSDAITTNGKPLSGDTTYNYLAFHKPIGYVCSRRQQGDNPTIYDIIPSKYHHLKPVGRLDKDSSGLILLTNDGNFAFQMTHPSFHKKKIYEVELNRDLEPLHQQMISDHGIQLEDGSSQFEIERMSDDSRSQWRIHMSEGRNRQIRRTFAALGYDVTKLHRTHFGSYQLAGLTPGELKEVSL